MYSNAGELSSFLVALLEQRGLPPETYEENAATAGRAPA